MMNQGCSMRRLGLQSVMLLIVGACAGGTRFAEPATATATATGANQSPAVATNQRGKSIFLDYCSFCHGVSSSARADGARGIVRAASGTAMSAADFYNLLADPPDGMPQIPLRPDQEAELIEYLLGVPQQSLFTQFGHP